MQEFGDSVNRTFQYAVRVGIHSEGRRNHAYYPDRLDRLNDALGDSMNRMIVCVFMLLSAPPVPAMAAMSLTSNDIQPGTLISRAQIYPRCGGGNISPQLSWSGVPTGTKSFVPTMIDTSVKPSQWSHWIVVDLPPDATSLARGVKRLPGGAKAIPSNFGGTSYNGPCPPNGTGVHEYELTIWAMSTPTISFAADMKASALRGALAKIALDHASLTGFLKR